MKLTDAWYIRSIGSITGVKVFGGNLRYYCDQLDEVFGPRRLLCPFSNLGFVRDQVQVVADLCSAKSARKCQLLVSEYGSGTFCLVSDVYMSGGASLFLVKELATEEDVADEAGNWLKKMGSCNLIVSTDPKTAITYMAARFGAFFS